MQWSRRAGYQLRGQHAVRLMWRYSFARCYRNWNDQER